MKKRTFRFELVILGFLLASCQSINRNRAELGISQSIVYFSFDDGPNAHGDTTARLLDVLKKYRIHALFSLLGENVEHNPDLARRIYHEGHYIVNHGYSGKLAWKMNEEEFKDNLAKGEAAISAVMGHELYPRLYRPHGGLYSAGQEKVFREAGYMLVPVNIRAYDAVVSVKNRHKVVRKIIGKIEKQSGGIILFHDMRGSFYNMERELEKNPQGAFNRSWIPEAVEEVIIILLEKGYIINGPDILSTIGLVH